MLRKSTALPHAHSLLAINGTVPGMVSRRFPFVSTSTITVSKCVEPNCCCSADLGTGRVQKPRSSPSHMYFNFVGPNDLDEIEEDGKLGPDEEANLVEVALRKLPERRTIEDCEVLQRATASVKFLKSMENEPAQVLDLCRAMTSRRLNKGEVVFKEGEVGATFYIIYSGSFKVLVNDYSKGTEVISNQVATLAMGDAFGELALVGNGLRAATVVAESDAMLLQVEKDAYESICGRHYEEKIARRAAFLRTVFLFAETPHDDLVNLAKLLTEKKFDKNATIIRQGTSTVSMYFLYSGRCRVLKQMELTTELAGKVAGAAPASRAPSGRPIAATSSQSSPVLEIGELTPPQFFGEKALIEAQKAGKRRWPHSASVVSITRVEVLILSKHDFHRQFGAESIGHMVAYADKFYYEEDSIRKSILEQHRWGRYKQELVRGALSSRRSTEAANT